MRELAWPFNLAITVAGHRKTRLFLLASAACAVACPAMAQDTASGPSGAQSAAPGDEIVVTGSRITANGFQQPTPVTVLGAAELKRETPTTIANYLNTLPAFGTPTSSANAGVGVSGGGQSLLNLRNLGTSRTLVLLDSRRVVSSGLTGGVDINTLPTSLVSRVEVVTGGASSAWGADAVAGVVNFVLNHDYKGLGIDLTTGISTYGDYRNSKIELTYGTTFAGGRGHIIAAGQYSWQPDIVRARDRAWYTGPAVVTNSVSGSGQPRYITVTGAGPTALAEGGVILSTVGGSSTTLLRGTQFVGPNGTSAPYNFGYDSGVLQYGGDAAHGTSNMRNLNNALNYGSIYGQVRYDLTDNITAYAEGSYGRSKVYADSLYYNRGAPGVAISVNNPYLDPATAAKARGLGITTLNIGKMFTDLEPPGSMNTRTTWRGVAGVEGSFGGSSWKWGAYYQHGEFHVDTRTYNNPLVARFNQAVNAVRDASGNIVCANQSNGCLPLNIFGTGVSTPAQSAAIAWVFGTVPYQIIDLKQDVVSADISGELFQLPAGAVSIAAGVDYTKESATSTQDDQSLARGYFTGNFQPFKGGRNVKEAFAEAGVPILSDIPMIRKLELSAAVRLTDYSTSGSVTTWKLGGSWEINSDLRLRVTRSRDIRAPSLSDLFNQGSSGSQFVFDPQTNTTPNLLAINTGNPKLTPEIAATWTGGIVYRPSWLPGFGLSVDYYDIRLRDAIASVTAPQTVQLCFNGSAPALCGNIVRNSAGVITQVYLQPTNVAFASTSGVDVEASYRHALGSGALSLRLLAGYINKLDQINPDGTILHRAGALGDVAGGQPKVKAQFSATYDQGGFSGTARVRFIGAAKIDNAWVEGVDVDNNSVPAMAYLDLRTSYKFASAWGSPELGLSIDNVLNSDPPTVPAVPTTVAYVVVSPGTRLDLYDAIGRQFRVSAKFKF